jgi:hypothetical protein
MARALGGGLGAMAKAMPVTASALQTNTTASITQQVACGPWQRRSPGVVSPAAAFRGGERTCEPRQRQAPDGRKDGGINPRLAVGAPGAYGWLRLFQGPEVKNIMQP